MYIDNIGSTRSSNYLTTTLAAIMGRKVAIKFTWSGRDRAAKNLNIIQIIKNINKAKYPAAISSDTETVLRRWFENQRSAEAKEAKLNPIL
jgi:hypothetical protein